VRLHPQSLVEYEMTEHTTALDAPAVHDFTPSTPDGQPAVVDKPRREWRVTKADLEAMVRDAADLAERQAERNYALTQRLLAEQVNVAHANRKAASYLRCVVAEGAAFLILAAAVLGGWGQ
jgi:hypothetical protein